MDANKFVTWNVMIDIGFWSRLSKKKMEQYQLDATPQMLIAKFRLSNRPEKLSILSIDAFSFGHFAEDKSGPVDFKVKGQFLNTNTIDQFQRIHPISIEQQLIQKQIKNFERFANGEQVNHLYQIFLLTFADLKKHIFNYQFFSTAIPVTNYKIISWTKSAALDKYIKQLSKNYNVFPEFTVLKDYTPSSIQEFINSQGGNYIFCIVDSTNLPLQTGYHTSTILAFFAWLREKGKVQPNKLSNIKILLLKEFLMYNVEKEYQFKNSEFLTIDASEIKMANFQERIKYKKSAQVIDLKSFMDNKSLAKEAVDLNIKLMKWRMLKTLDIQKIQSTKCLLFGAGTLGCQLARNLIGWGVKNITFIDYSKVSYSNPVRQTLYEYEDTINGGKPKAETAAQKLKKIYPQINSQGYNFKIPMPGHYVTSEDQIMQTFKNLDLLEGLVKEHDVLFLLLDSRQARWLPTVLANKYDKACITVGLGFDSFCVVRHGVSPKIHDIQKHGERISCYFCSDVVTPQNTMKDRTLDQVCTVTKPGLSFLSSAYAAELYISLLHHQLQHHAPASEDLKKLKKTDIGKLPHYLRGNMADFQTSIYYGDVYEKCVACSKYILDEYLNNREEFMLKVLNDPSFINKVPGLQHQQPQLPPGEIQDGIVQIVDDDFEQMHKKVLQQAEDKSQQK